MTSAGSGDNGDSPVESEHRKFPDTGSNPTELNYFSLISRSKKMQRSKLGASFGDKGELETKLILGR